MSHNNSNHQLVVSALNSVSIETGISYIRIRDLFINCDEDVTLLFWSAFYSKNPYKTLGVSFCFECSKFHLNFVKPLVPWSLEFDLESVH